MKVVHPAKGSNRLLLPTLIAGVLLAGGALLFFFNPAHSAFYPFCFFYKTTGLLCPGCGGLRATHQLLHGHVLEALHLNALFVLVIPLAVLTAARIGIAGLQNKPTPLVIKPVWLWAAFAVLVLFAILRNLPFVPFTWLGGR